MIIVSQLLKYWKRHFKVTPLRNDTFASSHHRRSFCNEVRIIIRKSMFWVLHNADQYLTFLIHKSTRWFELLNHTQTHTHTHTLSCKVFLITKGSLATRCKRQTHQNNANNTTDNKNRTFATIGTNRAQKVDSPGIGTVAVACRFNPYFEGSRLPLRQKAGRQYHRPHLLNGAAR